MKAVRHWGILNGLFVSVMVIVALIGTQFFGWKVAGLPFVPFDIFDQLTRILRIERFGLHYAIRLKLPRRLLFERGLPAAAFKTETHGARL